MTMNELIHRYEQTPCEDVLDEIVNLYISSRQEEHIEFYESLIDSSTESSQIYTAINEAYCDGFGK